MMRQESPRPVRGAIVALLGVLVVGLSALGAMAYFSREPGNGRVYRSTILATVTSVPGAIAMLALSPDGTQLAFVGDASGSTQIYLRTLDSLAVRPLAGTEGAQSIFWSPNGRSLAFTAANKLKTIDVAGSRPAQVIADAITALPGSWSRDDVILFTPTPGSPLFRVSASGGDQASPVTSLDKDAGELAHGYPSFLPDGRHFVYLAQTSGGIPHGVYVGSLDSSARVKLFDGGSNSQYAANALFYLRGSTLMAQPFDADHQRPTGEAVPVADGVEIIETSVSPRTGAFSVSETGSLVYRAERSTGSELQWLDRDGHVTGTLGDRAKYLDVMLSPDDSRALVSVMEPSTATRDLEILDTREGLRTRFTFDPEDDVDPRWSPDGTRIAFASRRKGHLDLYVKPANGVGSEELIYADDLDKYPQSWSPDGQYLMYVTTGGPTGQDLWVLTLTGDDRNPHPLLQTSNSMATRHSFPSLAGSGRSRGRAPRFRDGERTARKSSTRRRATR